MAEFYEVLRRAIRSLPENSGDARRGVYERARKALIAQLEGFSPPLTPSEITSQRLSLEEAIRKVEGEAARAALGLGPDNGADRPAPTEPSRLRTQKPPPSQPAATRPPEARPPASPPLRADAPATPRPPASAKRPAGPAVSDPTPKSDAAPSATARAPEPRLGPSPAPASPGKSTEPADTPDTGPNGPAAPPPGPGGLAGLAAPVDDESGAHDIPKSRLPLFAGTFAAFLIVVGLSAAIYSQRELLFAGGGDATPEPTVQATATPEPEPEEPPRRSLTESPRPEKSEDRVGSSGGSDIGAVRTVPTERVTVPSSSENGALDTDRSEALDQMFAPNEGGETGEPSAETETEVARAEPAETAPAAPSAPAGAVAQTAILYEEGATDSGSGNVIRGQVVWSKVADNNVPAVKADITIPEKETTVTLTIKPNTEDGFPASHLVEMEFSGSLGATIRTVPGLILKTTEQAQGDALVGAAIKVTDGLFWIALSAEDRDFTRNRGLLESRGWMDIPLLYATGTRAILTLEKGVPGDEAIKTAFGEWAGN
ncbi:MAG: hypothetical protein AAGF59_11365 [Pseudomonadota bacterium]